MPSLPLQFLLLTIAGWMTRDHQRVTEYLVTENALLREQLRGRRILYTDAQRRRLASAAKKLGRTALKQLDTLVTPDTLMRWYRRLVAKHSSRMFHAGLCNTRRVESFEHRIPRYRAVCLRAGRQRRL
jgi:transcription initiation factor TFIIIB Brf1 subunit/transcription initiation factor TFIIB